MNWTKLSHKPSIQGATSVEEREQKFELSLPTLVTGLDASGNEIEENTELSSISATEAIFTLESGVIIGSRLNLSLEIPKTLFLENHLKLQVSGKVAFVQVDQNQRKQIIALRLDQNYKICPNPAKGN